ncbi:Uncharacterised protein [Mycobacteroides abscessus subsp. abscessus]|nr:Uncharacterised protein [Mycobacteroides abscessus subsp. abscessus]
MSPTSARIAALVNARSSSLPSTTPSSPSAGTPTRKPTVRRALERRASAAATGSSRPTTPIRPTSALALAAA